MHLVWLSVMILCSVQATSENSHTKDGLRTRRNGNRIAINDHVIQAIHHVTDHVTNHNGRRPGRVANNDQQTDYWRSTLSSVPKIDKNRMSGGSGLDRASYGRSDFHRHKRDLTDPETSNVCTKNQFQCDNGECISISSRCDGQTGQYYGCADLSDENNCHNSTCPDHLFRCASGHCKYPTFRCDGNVYPYVDCDDGSDEIDCDNSTCPEQFFRCDNGQCVNIEERCNNDTSIFYSSPCNDGSDEVNCSDYVCPSNMFKCMNGFCVYKQTRCDNGTSGYTGCSDDSDEDNCEMSDCGSGMFRCTDGQCIVVAHVCDGYTKNCKDGSDESNCDSNVCPNAFRCSNGECKVDFHGRCDGLVAFGDNDCHDGSDEVGCGLSKCPMGMYRCRTGQCMEYDICSSSNAYRCSGVTDSSAHCGKTACAEDYFHCGNGICLHSSSRCDHVIDCPDGGDEHRCGMPVCRDDQFVCSDGNCIPMTTVCDGHPNCANATDEAEEICQQNKNDTCEDGFMCGQIGASVCIESRKRCDGMNHCLYSTDEHNCFISCPSMCSCILGRITCINVKSTMYNVNTTTTWPFGHLSNAFDKESYNIGTDRIHTLILTNASLRRVPTDSFIYTPYLHTLDLSYNLISELSSGNFNPLYTLSVLNLSNNLIQTVNDFTFKGIRIFLLDIRYNQIQYFSVNMFAGMAADGSLFTDSYKFCCNRPKNLPERMCLPHADQFSSCDDLMHDVILRSMLWTIGFISFLGNIITLTITVMKNKKSLQKGSVIFVSNLGFADLLMGVYLLTIASVDEYFRGVYITQDEVWRHSIWCTMAGVLSMLSSEASVFFISLITIDRYLVVKFPFGEYRIRQCKAITLSALSWVIALTIAVVPTLFDGYFKNEFFSKNGVCVALPLTTDSYTGWEYSVGVYVGLNCVLFTLIGIGQLMIYYEIIATRRQSSLKARGDELKIARCLMLVVASDFVCWIPIGCFGILAMLGRNTSPDVYAWIVILVLPVNSALNPFLYTFMSKVCK